MKEEKLMDAIGLLPADLILETDRLRSAHHSRPLPFRRFIPMAACLVLVIAAGMLALRLGLLPGADLAKESATVMEPQAPAATEAIREESAADTAVRQEAPEEQAPADTHPLTLRAIWSEGEVTAQAANYTLREILPGGEISETTACGAHPLQTNPEPTAVCDEAVTLFWEIPPDEITVRCWKAGATPEDPGIPLTVDGNRLTLLPECAIYEITARWGDTCTAAYGLRLDYVP